MIRAYFNYPNSRITVHYDVHCPMIQSQEKPNQRVITLFVETLTQELKRYWQREHAFASNSAVNDMWVFLDLGDEEFEIAVVAYIKAILAQRYTRFRDTPISRCC